MQVRSRRRASASARERNGATCDICVCNGSQTGQKPTPPDPRQVSNRSQRSREVSSATLSRPHVQSRQLTPHDTHTRSESEVRYGCRSWTKFVPSNPRRDTRLRDECDTVPPIFTHPANAPRLTMVTPISRRRIKAAYLWAGLAGLGLGDTLCSHVVRKVQKISYLRI